MRIAIVSLSYLPITNSSLGGLEVIVSNLIDELKDKHEITLFGLSDSDLPVKIEGIVSSADLREDGLALDNKYFVRRYTTYQALALKKALKQAKDFDVIHVHLAEWQHAFLYSNNENIVVTAHGNYMNPRLTKMILEENSIPKLTCISKFVHDNFFPKYNHKYLAYNGINIRKFEFNDNPEDYLVWLGRITKIKDPKSAIEVAQKTGKKLIIAGGIDYQDFFDESIKPYLNKQIQYIGPVFGKEKNELLAKAEALLFTPAWEEPFGLVATEAMACGTPVIAFNKGALPEIIDNNETGFIVDNVQEMAEKISEVKKIDRKKCRQKIEQNYTSEKMAEKYLEIYKK